MRRWTYSGPAGDGTWVGHPRHEFVMDEFEMGLRVALGHEDEDLGFGPLFDAMLDEDRFGRASKYHEHDYKALLRALAAGYRARVDP